MDGSIVRYWTLFCPFPYSFPLVGSIGGSLVLAAYISTFVRLSWQVDGSYGRIILLHRFHTGYYVYFWSSYSTVCARWVLFGVILPMFGSILRCVENNWTLLLLMLLIGSDTAPIYMEGLFPWAFGRFITTCPRPKHHDSFGGFLAGWTREYLLVELRSHL